MSSSSSDSDDQFLNDRFVGQSYGLDSAAARHGSVPFVSAASEPSGRSSPPPAPLGSQPTRVQPADFERHTKGFGSKYLAKFGFKGRLGKQGTGIAAPIEAKMRPTGLGLGFNDVDSKAQPASKRAPPAQQDRSRQRQAKASWRRDHAAQAPVVYKTAQEMLDQKLQSRMAAATFVDMRSRQGAQVKSFDDIAMDDDDNVVSVLPELAHNLQLIVSLAESQIETLERKRLLSRNELDALESRRDALQAKLTASSETIQRLEQVQAIVTRFAARLQPSSPDRLTLAAAADVFDLLQHRFQKEFREFRLEQLVVSLLRPFMERALAIADPILDRGQLPDDFRRWRFLLSNGVYDDLCSALILPRVRATLLSLDLVRDSDRLSDAVAAWAPALSPSALDVVFDTVLVPALRRTAQQCDPLGDLVQTHVWAHPWLPVLGEARLQPVHEDICRRFIQCLGRWSPDDRSVFALLQPWLDVFSRRDMHRLKQQAIIPRLRQALEEQTRDRRYASADIPAIDWLLQWKAFLGEAVVAEVLEIIVWPKLLRSVQLWLQHQPDYGALITWYWRWKALFQSVVDESRRIRQMLRFVLMLIHGHVGGQDLQLVRHQILQRIDSDRLLREQEAVKVKPKLGTDSFASAPMPATLHIRDLVSKYAEMNDLEFAPNMKLGRFQGKQIFTFGSANIYLDSNCVYYLPRKSPNREHWQAIGLSDLLQLARQ